MFAVRWCFRVGGDSNEDIFPSRNKTRRITGNPLLMNILRRDWRCCGTNGTIRSSPRFLLLPTFDPSSRRRSTRRVLVLIRFPVYLVHTRFFGFDPISTSPAFHGLAGVLVPSPHWASSSQVKAERTAGWHCEKERMVDRKVFGLWMDACGVTDDSASGLFEIEGMCHRVGFRRLCARWRDSTGLNCAVMNWPGLWWVVGNEVSRMSKHDR